MKDLVRPAAYRQTLIGNFQRCAASAYWSLVDEKRSPGELAARGSLLHRFFHEATREMVFHQEPVMSVEQGMELYAKILCQEDVPSSETLTLSMREMRAGRIAVVRWCENTVLDLSRITSIEDNIEKRLFADLTLPSGEVVQVTGQMDMIVPDPPEGIVIGDLKTGPGGAPDIRKEESASNGNGLSPLGWAQANIYGWLALENYPSAYYVKFVERHVMDWETRSMTITRRDMERIRDVLTAQVAMLHRAIGEGPDSPMWHAQPGLPQCSMCSGLLHCRARKDAKIPATLEEARLTVGEWEQSAEKRSVLNGHVHDVIDRFGPIEMADPRGRKWVGHKSGGRRLGTLYAEDIPDPDETDTMIEARVRAAGVVVEDEL